MAWPIRVDVSLGDLYPDKGPSECLVTRLSVGCLERDLAHTVEVNLWVLTVWCGGVGAWLQVLTGGCASLQERERLLRSKRHRGKSLKPPKVSLPSYI